MRSCAVFRDWHPPLASLLFALAASGCVLEPVPLDGLRCPCAAPRVCDEASNTCVDTLAAPCGRAGSEPSDVHVDLFERWWVTATQARLRWQTSAPESVASLAVDLAESTDALGQGSFTTIDGTTNPELARAFLPGTSGLEAVQSTILRALLADHAYVARLVVYDQGGHVSCSAPVPFRTNLAPHESLVLFEESLLPDAYLRTCSELPMDASRAASGTTFIDHTYRCQSLGVNDSESVCTDPMPPASSCWENVGFSGASLDLSGLTDGAFATAFVEVAIAVDDESSAFWAEPAITNGANVYYEASEITIVADGAYQTYDIPLARLTQRCDAGQQGCTWDTPLDRAAITTLSGFRIGMGLSNGAHLRLDDIRLRW